MPMRKSPTDVLAAFDSLPSSPTTEDVQTFLNENFYPAGSDVEVE